MNLRLAINTETNELVGISQDCKEVSLDPNLFRGPVGPEGPEGPVGPVGPVGPEGPVGAVGPVGPVGAVGPAGEDGQDGSEDEIEALKECVNLLVGQLQEILDKSPWLACEEPLNINCES